LTVTLDTAINQMSSLMGDLTEGTGTVSGGTTLSSSLLATYADGWWAGSYVRFRDTGDYRRIITHTGANATLNSATSSNGLSFELHKFDPEWKIWALNTSAMLIAPRIKPLMVDANTYTEPGVYWYRWPDAMIGAPTEIEIEKPLSALNVPNQLLDNPTFNYWTNGTTPDDWTASGFTPVIHRAGDDGFGLNRDGDKMVGALVTQPGTLSQTLTAADVEGKPVVVWADVYCLNPEVVSLTVGNGTSSTTGQKNFGRGWSRLTAHHWFQPGTNPFVRFDFYHPSSDNYLYLDSINAVTGSQPVEREWTEITTTEFDLENRRYRMPREIRPNLAIRVRGSGMFSQLRHMTDTIELDAPKNIPWYYMAIAELYERVQGENIGVNSTDITKEIERWRTKYEYWSREVGFETRRKGRSIRSVGSR
jgi:hypothetical protein